MAIEIFRPLANRIEEGPAADPSARQRVSGSWTLREPDDAWRELESPDGAVTTLPSRPVRIVSQVLVSDEVLEEICPAGRIVAHSTISADPRYSNIADLAQEYDALVSTSAEAILAFKPDLVFVASYSTLETVTQLQRAGVPLIQLSQFDSLESIVENIRVIGFAVGEDAAAAALIERMRGRIAAAVAAIPPHESKVRVLSWSDGTLPALNTTFDDIIRLIGAVNIPAETGLTGWPHISAEQVAKWDPEWIIIPAQPGLESEARDQLLENEAIAQTTAVREGHVLVISTPIYISVTHHVASMIEIVVDTIYATR